MSLKKVRLELARCPDYPEGSSRHGYEFIAPLTGDGVLDSEAWRKHRSRCTVRRFWEGEDDETGHLVHTRGRTWAFRYDDEPGTDDEPIYHLDRHKVVAGEYITIIESDGIDRTFKVVDIRAQ